MGLDRHEIAPGVRAAFTDRYGGVSAGPYAELNLGGAPGDDDAAAVAKNRHRVAAAIDTDPTRVVWMHQVHGADVAVVDRPWPDAPARVDALVTARPHLPLAVRVADCTPVLLADPACRVVAAVHAGRPGLAAGVVGAAVARMAELGARPDRMVAIVGPAVCGGCYEVPEDMRAAVVAAAGVREAWATTRWGTPAVDVPGGVVAQLRGLGVPDLRRVPVCTMESPRHYSYRRDGRTGRFAGYVWLDGSGDG
ncbi:MAG: peptidoglycan editing factor PgeF [Streptosporangiales bacterium]|nr:peptidoglycan editing factor PgeF [Streptosporangiales bacterium]